MKSGMMVLFKITNWGTKCDKMSYFGKLILIYILGQNLRARTRIDESVHEIRASTKARANIPTCAQTNCAGSSPRGSVPIRGSVPEGSK